MHDVLPADPIDAAAFRTLMSQFATGVCVVSAHSSEGELAGITVNSFVSVSLNPLLVSWSLQNTSSQFDLWSKAPEFTVSILADNQRHIARRYAARGSSALVQEDFVTTPRELPVIKGALGFLECRQWSLYPAGDHTVVFGEVLGLEQADDGKPLAFLGGAFCRIAE
ncbi:MAG: flavin reductase family protein [Pseudomonadota bacterium]